MTETGAHGPPIVIEAGAGGCGVEWTEVAELLAPRHVVRIDRPGLGASPYAPVPRDAEATATTLHEVLAAAQIPAPYVLVGHSISGLSCRAFAYLFPADTAGMVLVDPFDEDTDNTALPRGFTALQQISLRTAQGLTQIGLGTLMVKALVAGARRALSRPDRPGIETRLHEIADAVTTPSSFRVQAEGAAAVPTSRVTLRKLVGRGGFPPVPLRVLTPDSPPVNRMDRLVRTQNLNTLHPREAAASPHGSHHVIEHSSHLIHLDQPEVLADHIAAVCR